MYPFSLNWMICCRSRSLQNTYSNLIKNVSSAFETIIIYVDHSNCKGGTYILKECYFSYNGQIISFRYKIVCCSDGLNSENNILIFVLHSQKV